MRVCFYTLGCKVNLNETGALEQMFRGAGFTIVPEGEEADVFVVNSCTVTNFGDQKSRKWLRRAKRENPGAVTVLTGCYPQAFPEEAAQFMEADLVCGNGDRKAILDNVLKLLDGHERNVARRLDLAQQALDPLLELAAELGTCHKAGQVEQEDLLILQPCRHLPLGNALGNALGNGGLANARLTNEAGVVLLAAAAG